MEKIIVIVGATGTKKTKLAISLAKAFNAEIINADSFQVYKELNVGINKPTSQQLLEVKHHLINSHSIYDAFDIKIFQDLATELIKQIKQRNKNVIICGGSNLYIDALIKGYDLNKTDAREAINYFNNWTYDEIYEYVLNRDKTEALKIGYNNKKRIIRAAQIIYSTNLKKSELDNQKQSYIYDCFIIQTIMDKQGLYTELNNRTELMINNEWINEVKNLLQKDANIINLQAMKAIGYQQIAHSLIQNKEIDIEYIKQITRNLAKKQLTWCKNKYKDVYQFDIKKDNYDDLVCSIKKWLVIN